MSVEQWLRQYSDWRTRPPVQFPSPPTVEARILEMQENAGLPGGVGIKYNLIEVDGESFSVPPDGGLGELCDRMAAALREDARMREFEKLILALPEVHLSFIVAAYHVAFREHPRGSRQAAAIMGIPRDQYKLGHAMAIGRLEAAMVNAGMIRDGGITAARIRSDDLLRGARRVMA